MTGDPVENEFVGECRIVRMSLRGRGFLAGKDLQRHVAPIGLNLFGEVADTLSLEPATLASRDQHRAFDAACCPARPRPMGRNRVAIRPATPEKRVLMQIPD